jgi:dTDP-4-amino-4,6-dideoxygalactose transaminase
MSADRPIALFMPHVPKSARQAVSEVLETRWIGQGPRVDDFEIAFADKVGSKNALAVGSGTDALHLGYLLAGLEEGDEVITSVFTCTATNIPLLYIKATPVFADIDPTTLNISVSDVKSRMTSRTRAIVFVDYGGKPAELQELRDVADSAGVPLIEDAAHALGASRRESVVGSFADFTIFSFQAIKHITTGDGGMLTFPETALRERAKRLRWFGIDRAAKFGGIWENDIVDVGYKYQMTDIAAAMGLAALNEFDDTLRHRQMLLSTYVNQLSDFEDVSIVGRPEPDEIHAAWLCTISAEDRLGLQAALADDGIESGQVHYRNDRYSIFGGRRDDLPNMDFIEDRYLVLPLHTHMSVGDVERICARIKAGW